MNTGVMVVLRHVHIMTTLGDHQYYTTSYCPSRMFICKQGLLTAFCTTEIQADIAFLLLVYFGHFIFTVFLNLFSIKVLFSVCA